MPVAFRVRGSGLCASEGNDWSVFWVDVDFEAFGAGFDTIRPREPAAGLEECEAPSPLLKSTAGSAAATWPLACAETDLEETEEAADLLPALDCAMADSIDLLFETPFVTAPAATTGAACTEGAAMGFTVVMMAGAPKALGLRAWACGWVRLFVETSTFVPPRRGLKDGWSLLTRETADFLSLAGGTAEGSLEVAGSIS